MLQLCRSMGPPPSAGLEEPSGLRPAIGRGAASRPSLPAARPCIRSTSPPKRNRRRHRRSQQNGCRRHRKRQRIPRSHLEQQRLEKPPQITPGKTRRGAPGRRDHRFAKAPPCDLRRPRPERHPDADLPNPRRQQVRQNAENPGQRKRYRQSRERRQRQREEPPLGLPHIDVVPIGSTVSIDRSLSSPAPPPAPPSAAGPAPPPSAARASAAQTEVREKDRRPRSLVRP